MTDINLVYWIGGVFIGSVFGLLFSRAMIRMEIYLRMKFDPEFRKQCQTTFEIVEGKRKVKK